MKKPQRILAAVDFSPQSQAIVDHACEMARQSQAELHLIHVDSRSGVKPDGLPIGEAAQIGLERLGLERLASLVRPIDEMELTTEKKILHGVPHRAIVDYATSEGITQIVMGTHGRRGLTYLALGSVAARVLRDAPCPVQILKTPKRISQPLDKATEILCETYGEELLGSYAETQNQLLQTLVSRLDVSEPVAIDVLDQLQQREWITWEPRDGEDGGSGGTWLFVSGIEFVEDQQDFQPSTSTSPATELITRALKLRATDIHVDPIDHTQSRVRFRVDGKLSEYCRLDHEVAEHLINQWKMLADLDIAEPFRTKEGRVAFPRSSAEFRDVEARLTTAPVADGEAVAIRLFSRGNVFIPLTELGFGPNAQHSVDNMLRRTEGIILVTGPTGSGKTTTVYSMLETISSSGLNIVSIEDPVEFSVPFVRQMEVDERHGIDMTRGLRTMLRMDPDVVFLGEIRDATAADIAMRAASSGHYVFSTLHTRDVASVVTALRDLGLPDRSVAANISGIVNQRLMRRLCPHCRKAVDVSPEARAIFERHRIAVPDILYQPGGCGQCRESGYLGRIGVYEAIAIDADTRTAISNAATESSLRDTLARCGMVSLDTDALAKVSVGITDLDEAIRVRWLV